MQKFDNFKKECELIYTKLSELLIPTTPRAFRLELGITNQDIQASKIEMWKIKIIELYDHKILNDIEQYIINGKNRMTRNQLKAYIFILKTYDPETYDPAKDRENKLKDIQWEQALKKDLY